MIVPTDVKQYAVQLAAPMCHWRLLAVAVGLSACSHGNDGLDHPLASHATRTYSIQADNMQLVDGVTGNAAQDINQQDLNQQETGNASISSQVLR